MMKGHNIGSIIRGMIFGNKSKRHREKLSPHWKCLTKDNRTSNSNIISAIREAFHFKAKTPELSFKKISSWQEVKKQALDTIGKKSVKQPDTRWKYRILYAEHSPIRSLLFQWTWENLKYWVSVHLVRHKYGIEHYVRTQRTDRTGVNRNEALQSAPVNHTIFINAQAVINISRKRLCNEASTETRTAWKQFLKKLKEQEKELYDVCVPECVYRGFCPEFNCCGYVNTLVYEGKRKLYVSRCHDARENKK